jgi:hypothetical protein
MDFEPRWDSSLDWRNDPIDEPDEAPEWAEAFPWKNRARVPEQVFAAPAEPEPVDPDEPKF